MDWSAVAELASTSGRSQVPVHPFIRSDTKSRRCPLRFSSPGTSEAHKTFCFQIPMPSMIRDCFPLSHPFQRGVHSLSRSPTHSFGAHRSAPPLGEKNLPVSTRWNHLDLIPIDINHLLRPFNLILLFTRKFTVTFIRINKFPGSFAEIPKFSSHSRVSDIYSIITRFIAETPTTGE